MYEIYINETPLILLQNDQLTTQSSELDNILLIRYNGKARSLMQPIDMLEKTKRWEKVIIYHQDFDQLKKDFNSLYKLIEAAGGVVFNQKQEILTMFRRDFWDLPKGKIDKGETKEVAAIREVQEETGLVEVDLGDLLCKTFHTYKNKKGKRILKKTYWYRMLTTESVITPQEEEDIEKVEWMQPSEFLKQRPLYNTIRVVVEKAVSSNN